MKAIVLTAGYGRRMRPLTDTTHKTLLEVGGRTVVEWIVDALLANHIDDITFVTGYRAEEVQAFLTATYPALQPTYIHNERYAQTNNIHSLALALETIPLDDDLVLIECDLVFEPAVLARLLASPHANVALVSPYRPGMDGTVVELADGVLRGVIPPHLQSADFDFRDKYKTLNVYRLSREFCAGPFSKLLTYYARVIDDNQFYELVFGILIYVQRAIIHAEVLAGEKWAEIDDPNDLEVARFLFDESSRQQTLRSACGGYWNYDVVDFCYLRNQYFPGHAVLAELRNHLPTLVQNYGSAQPVLDRKMAYYLGCRPDQLVALNGLSQVYPLLRRFFQGRRALIPSPTFGEYPRAFPQADVYLDEVGPDLDAVAARVRDREVFVVVNPNNPTGSVLPTAWIHELAVAHPDLTVIVDESFIEFASEESILPMLQADPVPNVILLRSLSKTLGVPGLRLGALYTTHADVLAFLREELPVWQLNAVAEHFLEILLKHRQALADSWQQTVRDREQFAALLRKTPLVRAVYPSGGNFLLAALRCSRRTCREVVRNLLTRHGLHVKDCSDRFTGTRAYLRLAVRLPEENARLVECLAQLNDGFDGKPGSMRTFAGRLS